MNALAARVLDAKHFFTRNNMRAWRVANCTAAMLTLSGALAWGAVFYDSEHFVRGQFFVLAHFGIYTTTAMFFALRAQQYTRVDVAFAFGTPALVMILQAGVLPALRPAFAYFVLGFAVWYLCAAKFMQRTRAPAAKKLFDAFAVIATLHLAIAPYFAFEGPTLATVWAAEGALLVWSGLYERRTFSRALGVVLLTLATGVFVFN